MTTWFIGNLDDWWILVIVVVFKFQFLFKQFHLVSLNYAPFVLDNFQQFVISALNLVHLRNTLIPKKKSTLLYK